jgi:enoyl-[acyl-carrier protein] reductase I
MLSIDLRGKRALVAGVTDDGGFGFAIARALAEAGASICVGTWPRAYKMFTSLLERGDFDASLALSGGGKLAFERIYPLDASFDVSEEVTWDPTEGRRYAGLGDVSLQGVADRVRADFGDQALDVVVHAIANGPEVNRPLLDTSRRGYLSALGVSAYSFVSMVSRLGPLVRPGGAFLTISYLAANRVVPGYGGGMSSAKAALESDVRLLAFEAGRRWGHRVNAISAGPWKSRAAGGIASVERLVEHCKANAPLPEALTAREVALATAFLCSPLGSGVTGTTVFVDKGFHAMAVPATGVLGG